MILSRCYYKSSNTNLILHFIILERFEDEDEKESEKIVSTTSINSLRIFRTQIEQKGESEIDSEDECTDGDEEEDRPLDFTTTTIKSPTKRALENNNPTGQEYFMPFKNLEMKSPTSSHIIYKPQAVQLPPPPPLQHGLRRGLGLGHEDLDGPPSQKRRKGVQSFSIDEILSHKAASLAAKANQEQGNNHHGVPQAIVRPWDISSAAAAAAAVSSSAKNAYSVSQVATGRRKSMEDSPLDALFQMASKTFEGLKNKSGKKFKRIKKFNRGHFVNTLQFIFLVLPEKEVLIIYTVF